MSSSGGNAPRAVDGAAAGADGISRAAGTRSAVAARVWQAMRQLVLERYDRRQAVCEALGMSFIRAKALRMLADGPLAMRELAARLPADAPYTTLIVDDLERRGMATRTVHPLDRRSKIVTATAAGLEAAAAADDILGEPPEPLRCLPPEDLAALDRVVTKLLETSREPGVTGARLTEHPGAGARRR